MKCPDLPVDDHGVGAFLPAEVFIDHGLADTGTCGDLLHGGQIESLLGEECPAHGKELLTALLSSHPDSALRFGGHESILSSAQLAGARTASRSGTMVRRPSPSRAGAVRLGVVAAQGPLVPLV